MKKNLYNHREIRYSCITGAAIWLYLGTSKEACRRAYYRTARKEYNRRLQWPTRTRNRTCNITLLLHECMAALPIFGTMTSVQRAAVKALQYQIDNPPLFCSPFLDHDLERRHQLRLAKRRQRYWKDADFRLQERERQRIKNAVRKNENANYDK